MSGGSSDPRLGDEGVSQSSLEFMTSTQFWEDFLIRVTFLSLGMNIFLLAVSGRTDGPSVSALKI